MTTMYALDTPCVSAEAIPTTRHDQVVMHLEVGSDCETVVRMGEVTALGNNTSSAMTQKNNTMQPPLEIKQELVQRHKSKLNAIRRLSNISDYTCSGMKVIGLEESYIEQCQRYCVKIDPGILVCLRYGLNTLRPDSEMKSMDLFPLTHVLVDNDHVTQLDFSACRIGPSGTKLLVEILQNNLGIETLDLSRNRIGRAGMHVLSEFLIEDKCGIRDLRLASNRIGSSGGDHIRMMLTKNSSLVYLDVSRNNLSVSTVKDIETAVKNRTKRLQLSQKFTMRNEGNFNLTELLNSVTHGFGLVIAVACTLYMMYTVRHKHMMYMISGSVYCLSLCTMLLSSTLYHSFFKLKRVRKVFKALDHISIYLLIAGTYTPITVIGLQDQPVIGINILIVCWTLCILGIAMSITYEGENFGFWSNVLYITMGWMCVAGGRTVYHALPPDALNLIAAGGLFYTMGVYFVVTGARIPINHTIWHIMVMAGAACHYVAILNYIMII